MYTNTSCYPATVDTMNVVSWIGIAIIDSGSSEGAIASGARILFVICGLLSTFRLHLTLFLAIKTFLLSIGVGCGCILPLPSLVEGLPLFDPFWSPLSPFLPPLPSPLGNAPIPIGVGIYFNSNLMKHLKSG